MVGVQESGSPAEQVFGAHVRNLGEQVATRARTKIIRRGRTDANPTGLPHLADSIKVSVETGRREASVLVGSELRHAAPHHEGAEPHIIRANKAQALSFYWPKVGAQTFVPRRPTGATGFRRGVFVIGKGHVNHPGHGPNPYLLSSLSEVIG